MAGRAERKSSRDIARDVARLLQGAGFLVALTGAGISTRAGIPDFRGKKGIYSTGKYPPDVFDIDTFRKDPAVFYAFTRDFIELEQNVSPTFAHRLLARLEQEGRLRSIVTQNIDGLHQKAGSRNVLEMHGSYRTSHCLSCWKEYRYERLKEKVARDGVPRCDGCNGVIKPDIVFFGESVRAFEEAERVVARSDVLLVVGSSLVVHPAAYLPQLTRGTIIAVNRGQVNLPGNDALIVDADIDEFLEGVDAFILK